MMGEDTGNVAYKGPAMTHYMCAAYIGLYKNRTLQELEGESKKNLMLLYTNACSSQICGLCCDRYSTDGGTS